MAHLRRELGVAHGVELVEAEGVLGRQGYFAGDDAARLAALQAAINDPSPGAIWCARGGYGATRLLARLDPSPLERHPKAFIGFSDITALMAWSLAHARICSIHGPVVTQLATLGEMDRARVIDMLVGQAASPLVAESGTTVHGGRVEGPLIVGNLEVLRCLVGTPHLPSLQGCILAIEEVGERPYRIDRALTQLIASGALRGVRGVAVGQLLACEDPPEATTTGVSAEQAVIERLEGLGVPIVTGFPFGHDPHQNAALPFGALVRLDADNAALECLQSALY
jgi:muramoyltetrapeptide carboxypeptidase